MAVQIQHKTFTVDEYHRMIEAGILKDDDRVELLNGAIVTMAPIGTKHFFSVNRLDRILQRRLSDRALVSAQSAVTIQPDSEPQPDIALYHLPEDVYASRLPEASDTFLIVEVADSTLSYDRRIKVPLYAHAGIPEMWLVDLNARIVEVYRSPSPDGYRDVRIAKPGEHIAPAAFPDVVLAVEEMLA